LAFLAVAFGFLVVGMCGFLAAILAWELLPGNLACELYLGTCSWEPCLESLLGKLAWEPLPGNLAWGNEPLGNLELELVPGNLFWEPVRGNLGTLAWESLGKGGTFLGTWFPTLRGADFAAPTCSGTFTMAEDSKLTLLGKNQDAAHKPECSHVR